MTTLGAGDVMIVLGTVLGCTAVVAVVALILLRVLRRRSLAVHISIVVGAAMISLAASTLAIAGEMYISAHDLSVLVWAVAGAFVAAGLLTAALVRSLRTAFAHLDLSIRRVSAGATVLPDPRAARELAQVSNQLAQTSKRLTAARAEVERIATSRQQFLAGVSHDLRTPLTAIRALAEAGEEGLITEPVDLATQVRKQSEAMGRMIDDLFDLSRISTGTLPLHRERLSVRDLISDAVADVQQIARVNGTEVLPDLIEDCFISGDPHQLSRAVTNLLMNGIAHAPAETPVYISARCHKDTVLIGVRDLGDGVPPDDCVKMFELGWRADEARSASRTGTSAGLGLAIVQGVARAHGGEALAAHMKDGFCVSIMIPLAQDVPEPRRRLWAAGGTVADIG